MRGLSICKQTRWRRSLSLLYFDLQEKYGKMTQLGLWAYWYSKILKIIARYPGHVWNVDRAARTTFLLCFGREFSRSSMLNNAKKYQTVPNNPEHSKFTMYPSMFAWNLSMISHVFALMPECKTRPRLFAGALCDPGAAKEVGPWSLNHHSAPEGYCLEGLRITYLLCRGSFCCRSRKPFWAISC